MTSTAKQNYRFNAFFFSFRVKWKNCKSLFTRWIRGITRKRKKKEFEEENTQAIELFHEDSKYFTLAVLFVRLPYSLVKLNVLHEAF